MRFKPQILVVEDDPLSQDMLVRRLSARGLRVATVSDGQQCLNWLQSNAADLVLLDIQMPKLSGLEVIKQIRQHFTHDALPVIMRGNDDDTAKVLVATVTWIISVTALALLWKRKSPSVDLWLIVVMCA